MKRVAILFPGQGAQYVGMGKKLCDTSKVAIEVFEEASEALGMDLKKLCFDGPMEKITKTEVAQPVILTTSVAFYKTLMNECELEPSYMAGHSLGEISALCCAGALEFSDAVKIVNARGRFMQEAVPEGVGSMAAVVGIGVKVIEELCSKYNKESKAVTISNYNSPDQIVISGLKDYVNKVGEELKSKGATVTALKVSAPFHSWLMNPAADKFREELKKYSFTPLRYPVLSNVNACTYESEKSIVDNLVSQLISPVKWVDIMSFLEAQGVDTVIDVGPKTVLRNLTKKNDVAMNAYGFDVNVDKGKILDALGKKELLGADEGVAYSKVIAKCISIAVCTKNRNLNEENYQNNVVAPYREIVKMRNELEEKKILPDREQALMALSMLDKVFQTKETPLEEQRHRFVEIRDDSKARDLLQSYCAR